MHFGLDCTLPLPGCLQPLGDRADVVDAFDSFCCIGIDKAHCCEAFLPSQLERLGCAFRLLKVPDQLLGVAAADANFDLQPGTDIGELVAGGRLGESMVRFGWHVEDNLGAHIPPDGVAAHRDTQICHATCHIEVYRMLQAAAAATSLHGIIWTCSCCFQPHFAIDIVPVASSLTCCLPSKWGRVHAQLGEDAEPLLAIFTLPPDYLSHQHVRNQACTCPGARGCLRHTGFCNRAPSRCIVHFQTQGIGAPYVRWRSDNCCRCGLWAWRWPTAMTQKNGRASCSLSWPLSSQGRVRCGNSILVVVSTWQVSWIR